MTRLSRADQKLVLDALKDLYAETDLSRLPEKMVRISKRLVASDLGSYNDFNRKTAQMRLALRFPDSEDIRSVFPAFLNYFRQHPLVPRIRRGGGPPMKFSDVVSQAQLERLGIYNEYFRMIGVRRQLLNVFDPSEDRTRGVTLNRGGKDFTERDREILGLLQPHLTQAFQNVIAIANLRSASAALEALQAAQAQALLLVDRDHRVAWVSAQGREWSAEYFQVTLELGTRLPDALVRWLKIQRENRKDIETSTEPAADFRVNRPRGALVVRYAAEDSEGNASLVLTLESAAPVPVQIPTLTARENEVLGWIGQGKANREIASILGLSVRTVYKHVENIFAKLHVESRASAMLLALDAAKRPQLGRGRRP